MKCVEVGSSIYRLFECLDDTVQLLSLHLIACLANVWLQQSDVFKCREDAQCCRPLLASDVFQHFARDALLRRHIDEYLHT